MEVSFVISLFFVVVSFRVWVISAALLEKNNKSHYSSYCSPTLFIITVHQHCSCYCSSKHKICWCVISFVFVSSLLIIPIHNFFLVFESFGSNSVRRLCSCCVELLSIVVFRSWFAWCIVEFCPSLVSNYCRETWPKCDDVWLKFLSIVHLVLSNKSVHKSCLVVWLEVVIKLTIVLLVVCVQSVVACVHLERGKKNSGWASKFVWVVSHRLSHKKITSGGS